MKRVYLLAYVEIHKVKNVQNISITADMLSGLEETTCKPTTWCLRLIETEMS